MRKVARVFGVIARLALWISATGLVAMTAFVAYQVFGRFVLNSSPVWTEPVAVMLMGWFIFLGAAVGIREGYHLSFDILIFVLPQRAKEVLFTISDIIVAGFAAGMVWYGIELARGTWAATLPSLGLPGGVTFFALTSGGALMFLFSLERVARRLAGLPTARFGETAMPEE